MSAKSTGERQKGPAMKKARAAQDAASNFYGYPNITPNSKLADFALAVFEPDSRYMETKRRTAQREGSQEYIESNRSVVKNYITPWCKGLILKQFRQPHVEDFHKFLTSLPRKLANSTIRRILLVFMTVLREAAFRDLISNASVPLQFSVAKRGKERHPFTFSEVKGIIQAVDDTKALIAIQLAAFCGLRLGEIQALRYGNISDNFIRVTNSFSELQGFVTPKSGKTRTTVIPDHVRTLIFESRSLNENNESLIFPGHNGRPTCQKALTRRLRAAAHSIGISDKDWKSKLLGFHALRHFFVTQTRGQVSDTILCHSVGHSDSRITDRYTHIDLDFIAPMVPVTNELFERVMGAVS